MGIDDPILPAAVHLTGAHAGDVLGPAVEHVGGRLLTHRCSQVHYRPGHDLTVRFRCEIDWGDGLPRRETLYAGTSGTGAPPGAIAVTAALGDTEIIAGVWRWPFDPHLPALEAAIRSTAGLLEQHDVTKPAEPVEVDVVTYRPLERAVLRASTVRGTWYLKLVRPTDVPDLVRRHVVLGEQRLPVPRITAHDAGTGLVIMEELAGPTLRDLVKADAPTWVPPGAIADLVRRLAAVDAGGLTAMRSRLRDAPHHLTLLSSVLPDERNRLGRIDEHVRVALDTAGEREPVFVHGDLHERQLVVVEGGITGLLDVDEAGLGDPLDDVAVPVAHLRHRALTAPNSGRIGAFVDDLVGEMSTVRPIPDIATGAAAVLAGLATGPFRAQQHDWPQDVRRILDVIEHLLDVRRGGPGGHTGAVQAPSRFGADGSGRPGHLPMPS